MNSFKGEKNLYIDELRNMLLSEGLLFSDYLKELGESNENLVRNPSNEEELNIAKKALEIFTVLKDASRTEEFDPESNSAYTIGCLIIKGVSNNEYLIYATELDAYMSSTEYLKGKYIVDKQCMPKSILKGIMESEIEKTNTNPQEFALSLLSAASFVALYYGKSSKETEEVIEKGIKSYIYNNECVLTYMNERDINSKNTEYIKKYKIIEGI